MAGSLLAMVRVGWIQVSWLEVIWPILASMFMFRLITDMYDLKHGKAAPTLASTLSYFFLLPNVFFPFFPVVDYSTYRRTYYNEDQHEIYQKGLRWMFLGVIHLILYRFINYYLMIAPEDVTNSSELVRYLIFNFALYLRISGLFHFIIGILQMFGFNLPETNHLYFLSSSFTDLWRRINIYWKEFMRKVFYYPTFFKIRKLGAMTSLVLVTACVFFMTWFLHAYQWFWLRGEGLLAQADKDLKAMGSQHDEVLKKIDRYTKILKNREVVVQKVEEEKRLNEEIEKIEGAVKDLNKRIDDARAEEGALRKANQAKIDQIEVRTKEIDAEIEEVRQRLVEVNKDLSKVGRKEDQLKQMCLDADKLQGVQCHPDYEPSYVNETCRFIKDAVTAKRRIPELQKEIANEEEASKRAIADAER